MKKKTHKKKCQKKMTCNLGGYMFKVIKFLAIALIAIQSVNANIDVILEDEINFQNSQGLINGNVISNNQIFQALGTYKKDKNGRVIFEIDRLMKGQKLSLLDKKPRVTKQLKNPDAILTKGSKITFKGEDKKEFKKFAEQIKETENVSTNISAKNTNKIPQNSSRSSGSSSGSGGSIGGGSISSGSMPNNNIQAPYIPPTYTTTTTDENGNTTTEIWNAQFCKAPEFLENGIKLVIVDKDGSCVEKMAVRDDSKCDYRLDFANNKAIKQTQFYYVDNENKIQNVGDCVDLVGAEYQSELYKDDTRCSLEHIDKDYNGGKASFFVTQILFRGIDGLIHEATDCIAYGNVKEELVDHVKDDSTRTAQRIVNQYYINPYTNEKEYLTKGVKTNAVFNYVENACGDWEMNDVALQGKKRTEITFYDDVEYKTFNVTNCDFSTEGGKKSEYIAKYQNLSAVYKEKELSRKSETFNISQQTVSHPQVEWESCKKNLIGINKCSGSNRWAYQLASNNSVNWTTTYVEKDVTDYETYLRPDGTQYQFNKDPSGATFKKIDREVKINNNDFQLTQDWLLYWEIHNKKYTNKTTEQSNQYQSWLSSKVKASGCQIYLINNTRDYYQGWASCTTPLNYILTNL